MIDSPAVITYFFAVTVLSYFVKGITGFGNTLVMSPLFSFTASNRLTTPVDLLLSLPTNAYMAYRERKHISAGIVLPLSLLLAVGIVPGVFLLKIGSDWMLKAFLGLVVVAMAVEMALRRSAVAEGRKLHPAVLAAVGVASGVLCGLFGIGALLVAYVNRTTDSMGAFRANLCSVFITDNVLRLVAYVAAGMMTARVLLLSLILMPAAVLGMFLGIRAGKRMRPDTAKKAVLALLAASGTALFVTNVFFH